MIYLAYLIVAALVVLLSNKASEYVDLLDKKTSLSGAFIGGVMLSAVTSLPELFTSISSTVFLDKPGLCMGNILGSNLFNLVIIACLTLIFYKAFSSAKLVKSHAVVALFVVLIYLVILANMYSYLSVEIMTVSVTSLIIIVLYALGIKFMSGDNGEESDEDEVDSNLTIKQIVVRFVLVSLGIIALSIIITYITDDISERLNLGKGLAGAIFLGIATSLPELSSTITLFRIKNYNIAFGNIIGSNIFNFLILAIADVIYVGGGLYDFSDPKTVNLLIFGTVAAVAVLLMIKWKNKLTQLVCPLAIIACYLLFLIV
jgi:cation:H+ antiporter